MQTSIKETSPPAKQVRPRGVLGVSYSLNCGACGMTSNHMPDPKIKSWEDLLRSISSGGMWKWKLTKKWGWVCGCQEIKKRLQREAEARAARIALSQKDGDLPF